MTLRINSLTGFGGGGGGYSFALVDTDTTQNNTNSPSFSGLTAGGQKSGRILIAAITCSDNDTEDATFWPATCTIGGVTADRDSFIDLDNVQPASLGVAVYSAVVPSGATVTVDITIAFTGTMDDWACALFRATGINKTPVDTDLSTSSLTLDTSAAKFVIVGAVDKDANPTDWTGGGNTTIAVSHGLMIIAYDDAPLGGATDVYGTTSDSDALAGAAYG